MGNAIKSLTSTSALAEPTLASSTDMSEAIQGGESSASKALNGSSHVAKSFMSTREGIRSLFSNQVEIHKGYSPYIDEETGHWFEYDDRLKHYVDTGISASSGAIEDYLPLTNKPRINNVELINNKTLADLGHEALTNLEIDSLLT